MQIHIGKIIGEAVDKKTEIENIDDFCKSNLQMTKQNYYRIRKKETIHTDLLLRFCKALNIDFFNFYYEDEFLYSISKREIEKLKLEVKDLTKTVERKEDLIIDLERKVTLLKEEYSELKRKKGKS